jgi:DNA polymerase I-like protein with 3'-5' exonuclease and polymerase domains
MGAKVLRANAAKRPNNIRLALAEAQDFRNRWKATYYGVKSAHNNVEDGPVSTRTFIGRRCKFVRSYTKKLALPVQGTAADGQKAAMALLYERRRQIPGVALVLSVYDENVLEVPVEHAVAAGKWLEDCMVTAMQPMLPDVPVKVDVTIGETWAG